MTHVASTTAAGPATSVSRTLRWWYLLPCALLPVLLPGVAILLLACCPVILLAVLLDRGPMRRVLRTVALFSLAGLIVPFDRFLRLGHDSAASLQVALEGGVIRVWAAGGIGWTFSELASVAGALAAHLLGARQHVQLLRRLAALDEEWTLSGSEDGV